MVYPVFLQDLRVAVNQTVLPCVAVSNQNKEGLVMLGHT